MSKDAKDTEWSLPVIATWQSHLRGEKPAGAFECILYTDSEITGQVEGDCGPYHFLNTVPVTRGPGIVSPHIVLRCFYSEQEEKQVQEYFNVDGSSRYHGGTSIIDEIAALSSLFLGVRIWASDVTRGFENLDNDPMGRPRHWSNKSAPTISFQNKRPVMPSVMRQKNLSELHALNSILVLDNTESVSLIRAARLYQNALWMGDVDQNLAWIMLVSALEAVAGCWRSGSSSNKDIMSETLPKLTERLKEECSEPLVDWTADQLAHLTGSTRKFLDFCLEFLPGVPDGRPSEFLQIEWTEEGWKDILKKVYKYRSKALHDGIPFPLPMGDPPYRLVQDAPVAEVGMVGLAVSYGDFSWQKDEVPINLNLFVVVTRLILLNWIVSKTEKNES